MDRVQTIWTMFDSRLKSSSQRNWSSVATTKHQERGVFPGRSPAKAKANATPRALRLCIVPGSPLMAQTTSLA